MADLLSTTQATLHPSSSSPSRKRTHDSKSTHSSKVMSTSPKPAASVAATSSIEVMEIATLMPPAITQARRSIHSRSSISPQKNGENSENGVNGSNSCENGVKTQPQHIVSKYFNQSYFFKEFWNYLTEMQFSIQNMHISNRRYKFETFFQLFLMKSN